MDKTKVLGKALYLELRKNEYTYQIILTPETMDDSGNVQPMRMLRRQISSTHPRKMWRFDTARASAKVFGTEILEIADFDAAKQHAKLNLQFIKNTTSQLFHGGWRVYKQPIAIEYSAEDMRAVKASETPTALIRRLMRARTALEFPETLWEVNPTA